MNKLPETILVALDGARTQTTAPTSATIGRSVQLPAPLSSQLLGTNISKMNRIQGKTQLEQGQLINIVLDYAQRFSYSVSMYCAYPVLSELQFNSYILNLRHAGRVDHEHPITGMLRYFALIQRARRKPNQPSALPYTEFRHMEAILQKVAADKGIELPNNDALELALYVRPVWSSKGREQIAVTVRIRRRSIRIRSQQR